MTKKSNKNVPPVYPGAKKPRKQFNSKRFFLDFFMLIFAMMISNLICMNQGITGGLLYGVICLCMMIIMLGASAVLNKKFFEKEDK